VLGVYRCTEALATALASIGVTVITGLSTHT